MPLVAGVALSAAHVFDLATFVAMVVSHGLKAEANPFVQRLTVELGLPGILIGKGALVVYLVAVVAIIATRRPRLAAGIAVFGTVAGVVGGISNVVTIGML
jgi:hypothetical protein